MGFIKKYFRLISALILLPAVIFISVYSLDQNGFFKIQNIDIKVNTLNSQKNFIAEKITKLNQKLNAFKGASLWRFPLSQVAEILKTEDWIKDFQLSRSWPSSLAIEIESASVAFLIQTAEPGASSSSFHPVTESGEILTKIDSTQTPNTIVVHDSNFLKNKKIREGALTLMKALPNQGRLHPSQISEIGFDKKEGYWLKLLQSELKINLGEEKFEIKTARVAQVLDYLENRQLKARVIDANLSKKVLVRMH